MPKASLPHDLIPNTPENVNQLMENLEELENTVNGLDGDNFTTATATLLGLNQAGTNRSGFAEVSTEEGTSSMTPSDLSTVGPSVTVVVPGNGLLVVRAQCDLQNSSGGAFVTLSVGGSNVGQILTTANTSFETRYTMSGSSTGTTTELLSGWIVLCPAAGSTAVKLQYHSGAAAEAKFKNRKLWVYTRGL